jgi:hypothetical protein
MIRPRAHLRDALPAWVTAAGIVVLSVVHLAAASTGDLTRDPVVLVSLALGLGGILAAIRFAAAGCFESRLAMILIAAASVVLAVLTHTIGAPGTPALRWSPVDVALLVLAAGLAAITWRATEPMAAAGDCSR